MCNNGRSTDGVPSPRCFQGDDLAPEGNVKKDDSSSSAHIKLWKRARLRHTADDAAPQQQQVSQSKTNTNMQFNIIL